MQAFLVMLAAFLALSTTACGGAGNADGDAPTDGDAMVDGDEPVVDGDLPTCSIPEEHAPVALLPDGTFDLGPYLMNPTPDGLTVLWRTLEPADGWVAVAGVVGTFGHDDSRTVHEVRLTGLEPGREYLYTATSGGQTSMQHRFVIDPGPHSGFRFTVWGDNQNGPETFRQVVASMAGFGPDLLLGVGDHVQDGTDHTLWKEQLFEPARALFHRVAFAPAIGNHEANGADLYLLYDLPHPELEPFHESYYSYRFGNVFFLVLDTNKPYFPILDHPTDLSAWAEEQASSDAARSATWRIAYAHEPGYSEGWGDGSCTYDGSVPVREWLLPMLAANGFHAYFSGHTHGYERARTPAGLTHLIVGGGGGTLDAWCLDFPETSVAHYVHHHLVVDAGCDDLRIEAFDLDGTRFDWVVLNRQGTILEEGPMAGLPPPVINSDAPGQK